MFYNIFAKSNNFSSAYFTLYFLIADDDRPWQKDYPWICLELRGTNWDKTHETESVVSSTTAHHQSSTAAFFIYFRMD